MNRQIDKASADWAQQVVTMLFDLGQFKLQLSIMRIRATTAPSFQLRPVPKTDLPEFTSHMAEFTERSIKYLTDFVKESHHRGLDPYDFAVLLVKEHIAGEEEV